MNGHDHKGDGGRGPWATLLAVAGCFAAAFALASGLSVLVVRLAESNPGRLADALLSKGPSKVTIRLLQVFAVLSLPLILRSTGWKGWKDIGWRSGSIGRSAFDFAGGWLLGAVTLAGLFGIAVLAGVREWSPEPGWTTYLPKFFGVALTVGIFEETVVRGILYRSLARSWTPLWAAVCTSVLFACAHFFRPSAEAFQTGSWLAASWQVLVTTFTNGFDEPMVLVRLLNLTLMGCLLCLFVQRRGTVWAAAGTHAAWVWMIRVNMKLTDGSKSVENLPPGFGVRSDSTDWIYAVVLLSALIVLALAWRPRRTD